jgi:Sec-independent protein translocase protein TatA
MNQPHGFPGQLGLPQLLVIFAAAMIIFGLNRLNPK